MELELDDIQCDSVLAFLDHVESKRGNSPLTRNCRLAAVRNFVQRLLRQHVTRAGQYGRILAIRNKRALCRAAIYLEPKKRVLFYLPLIESIGTANAITLYCCSSVTREHE